MQEFNLRAHDKLRETFKDKIPNCELGFWNQNPTRSRLIFYQRILAERTQTTILFLVLAVSWRFAKMRPPVCSYILFMLIFL